MDPKPLEMRMKAPLIIGLFGSLVLVPALAGDINERAEDSAAGTVRGTQTGEELGSTGDRLEGTGAANNTGQQTDEASGVTGSTSAKAQGSTAGNRKPASTGTAVRYLNEKVRKGDIKIEGMTDADTATP